MDKQLYLLYELILVLKAEVKGQTIYWDPATFQEHHWIEIHIDPDDPPLLIGPGFANAKREFLVKLRPCL